METWSPDVVQEKIKRIERWKDGDGPNDLPAWQENMERRMIRQENGGRWRQAMWTAIGSALATLVILIPLLLALLSHKGSP